MAERIIPIQGRQTLLERCRELEFVDDVQDLRCTRCNRLALEHWYTNCGHALCPNCKRLLSGGGFKCPQCDQLIQHIKEQSADFEERLNDLQVKCPNNRYGCPLQTTVKLIMEHVIGCKWTKEQILPAVYRGVNTTHMLLEEMSSLKKQMFEMKRTNEVLLNELNERLKAEADFKKSVEMSVEDLKSRLNGLSSDLNYETTALKVQLKDFDQSKIKELPDLKNISVLDINNKLITLEKTINEINLEKLKKHFVTKDEQKQMEDKIVSANTNGNKILIQILDQKEDRFSQKLTKEVEALNTKIVTSECKMEAALTKNKQEAAYISKNLQDIFEKSSKELEAQLQKLSLDLNQSLKQKEMSFYQKLSNEVKQLDEKIYINKTAVEMNGKEICAKMEAMKSEIKKQEVELKRQNATNVKNMQEKLKGSIEELKQQLVEVKSDVTQGLKQEQLAEEINVLEEKIRNKNKEIDKRINNGYKKQEVALENCRREMANFSQLSSQFHGKTTQLSHDIESGTKELKEEIEQLNKKTCKIKKNVDEIFNFLFVEDYRAKVQTIQQLNPQLNPTETFQRRAAIEKLLNRKLSVQQLVDSFLFGSAKEQMAFESLCFKWNIKDKNIFLPLAKREECVSNIFPVYGLQLKAQLKLTNDSDGGIKLRLCFKDEDRNGQEVDLRPLPMITYIIIDFNRDNKNIIRYDFHPFNKSLQYNQFGYKIGPICNSHWTPLISPGDVSLKVLALVEPLTSIRNLFSVDGTITDTIEHYSRKLEMAEEGLIYVNWSPPFLTHTGGYRVAIGMWLNGSIGVNKRGLVAWISFLSGEFDSQLGSEFEHETRVTLINQSDANRSITVKQQAKKANYYYMEIASEDEIDSKGLLVNDSLTYHVTIKPIKIINN